MNEALRMDYPRPDRVRGTWCTLNGQWDFAFDQNKIGKKEKFIDLLFYNLNLRCYVVIEVKMGEFDSGDIGQIGTYVTAVNHILCKDGIDNPTIGLLICKSKDSLLAQYALESSSQPIGISEFELSKLYPEKVEGTIPTCEELEQQLMKDKE